MEKRKISLGFKEASLLEDGIIYVQLGLLCIVVVAKAVSNAKFTYHRRWLNGNIITLEGKCTDNYSSQSLPAPGWTITYPIDAHTRDYNKFLDDLVQSNDAVLDYSRLIEEGARAYSRIEAAKTALKSH